MKSFLSPNRPACNDTPTNLAAEIPLMERSHVMDLYRYLEYDHFHMYFFFFFKLLGVIFCCY